MKFILTSALLAAAAFGSAVPTANKKVDYTGFKLIRLAAADGLESKIEELAAHVLNPGKSAHLDVVVSPDRVAEVSSLVADSEIISEDVGAIIASEGEMGTYAGKFQPPTVPHHRRISIDDDSPKCIVVHSVPPLRRSSTVSTRPPGWLHQQLRDYHGWFFSTGTCHHGNPHLGLGR
jgi:hypothetical protein